MPWPIGTVPIYSMIIGRKIEELDWPMIEADLNAKPAPAARRKAAATEVVA